MGGKMIKTEIKVNTLTSLRHYIMMSVLNKLIDDGFINLGDWSFSGQENFSKTDHYKNATQESSKDYVYTIIRHITKMSDADRKMCQYFLKHHKESLGYLIEFFAYYSQSRLMCDIEYKEI
jgi:hypothetical protein